MLGGVVAARPDPSLRLPLGVDTYRDIHAAYLRRLDQLESWRAVAESVAADVDGADR